jgi:hypothetical protein
MKHRKVSKLFRDSGGVSAVISNVILVGAVIVIGLGAVAWTYSQSSMYQTQYGELVNSDIDKLKERVSFEYVFYDNTTKSLSVYLMNSGKAGNLSITTVYVMPHSNIPFTGIQLKFLNEMPTLDLGVGQEGYFVLSPITLQQENVYTVKIVTGRGSSFENTFVA